MSAKNLIYFSFVTILILAAGFDVTVKCLLWSLINNHGAEIAESDWVTDK